MKNAIIIHGKPKKEIYYSDQFPSSSNFAWIPWLQKQLIINDIKADTPEMPHAYEPNYKLWKREFERFDIGKETSLVGHSAGGAFLLRWLSENQSTFVDKVALVAPSFHTKENEKTEFLEYELSQSLGERANNIFLFISDNDSVLSQKNAKTISERIKTIKVINCLGYGHFIPEHMGKSSFEELFKVLK